MKTNHRADLTTLGIVANKAAYAGGEDWLNQCVDYIDGNHDFVGKFINANMPMIKAYEAAGHLSAWLDVTAPWPSRINAKGLAEEANAPRAPAAPASRRRRWSSASS